MMYRELGHMGHHNFSQNNIIAVVTRARQNGKLYQTQSQAEDWGEQVPLQSVLSTVAKVIF